MHCRRNRVVVVLTTSWHQQSCCGCRQTSQNQVLWTLVAHWPDRWVLFCMQLWRSLLHECRLKGNSTLKNMSPKINIYDKWIYVSVIKLTMKIRYRRILTIKLLISANVFLRGGGSSKPSSLFLCLCLFVDVHVVTRNGCSYVLSCVKRALFPLSGRKFHNHSIHISYPFWHVMLLLIIDLQQSVAPLFTHGWRHFWRHTVEVRKKISLKQLTPAAHNPLR